MFLCTPLCATFALVVLSRFFFCSSNGLPGTLVPTTLDSELREAERETCALTALGSDLLRSRRRSPLKTTGRGSATLLKVHQTRGRRSTTTEGFLSVGHPSIFAKRNSVSGARMWCLHLLDQLSGPGSVKYDSSQYRSFIFLVPQNEAAHCPILRAKPHYVTVSN